jgi:hypothetical protein
VIALVILGWAFAMNLGRAIGPVLLKRLEPGTAGTVGFLIRLATLVITVLVALRLAGLKPETLAVGGAITAVILGLAAQHAREPRRPHHGAQQRRPLRRRGAAARARRRGPSRQADRIRATPADSADGPSLADEVVAALDQVNNGPQVG